jgi:hypothetical protein
MKRAESMITAWGLCLGILLLVSTSAFSQEVTKLSKEDVKRMLGTRNLFIIDLQHDGDLGIQGAVREDSKKVISWMGKYPPDKTLVFYCA